MNDLLSSSVNYDDITWFPLCVGVTVIGLVLSFLTWRRRGAASGMRGAAWSLLPLGLYLTGVIPLLWRIGVQIGKWVGGLVFKPTVWAGGLVLALAVLLWVISGLLLRHRAGKSKPDGKAASDTKPRVPAAPADRQVAGRKDAASSDDDLGDVEEILKRHGIT